VNSRAASQRAALRRQNRVLALQQRAAQPCLTLAREQPCGVDAQVQARLMAVAQQCLYLLHRLGMAALGDRDQRGVFGGIAAADDIVLHRRQFDRGVGRARRQRQPGAQHRPDEIERSLPDRVRRAARPGQVFGRQPLRETKDHRVGGRHLRPFEHGERAVRQRIVADRQPLAKRTDRDHLVARIGGQRGGVSARRDVRCAVRIGGARLYISGKAGPRRRVGGSRRTGGHQRRRDRHGRQEQDCALTYWDSSALRRLREPPS
jgi:hypothetical protein